MKILKNGLPLVAVLVAASLAQAASPALTSSTERYLHVKVNGTRAHQMVRINLPLSLAEKVIPAINQGQLRDGKVQIGSLPVNDINLKMILEALRDAPAGDFVTVQESDNDVRVAKQGGQLIVHVNDKKGKQNVDVAVPWEVAQALTSGASEGELNVEAAVKALENVGDVTLVSVTGNDENVRIWIDSRSAGE